MKENAFMDPSTSPRIVALERHNDGVVITFDDGSGGFYPESLLYEVLSRAEPLDEADIVW